MNCAISAATVTNLCKERNYLLHFLMVAAGKLHWNSKLLYFKYLNIMIIYFVVIQQRSHTAESNQEPMDQTSQGKFM